MARSQNLPLLLTLLGLAGGALIVSTGCPTDSSQPTAGPAARSEMPAEDGPRAEREPAYPNVNLEGLRQEPIAPDTDGRNPFGLEAPTAPQPPATPDVGSSPPQALPLPGPPPGPPSAPPLALKFIGIVNLPGNRGRLAVLSDGDFVYHGRQGDIVEGRYRILSIGDESIELEFTDGQGTRVLPLSGA